MSKQATTNVSERPGKWLSIVAGLGIAWNLFGALPFFRSVTATEASLMASGMTQEQAAAMTGYPIWVTIAFAIGVMSGIVGSVLLLMRHALTQPVLVLSLVMYSALWGGYAFYGVFAAFGMSQIVIMTTVVVIAVALLVVSRSVVRKNS